MYDAFKWCLCKQRFAFRENPWNSTLNYDANLDRKRDLQRWLTQICCIHVTLITFSMFSVRYKIIYCIYSKVSLDFAQARSKLQWVKTATALSNLVNFCFALHPRQTQSESCSGLRAPCLTLVKTLLLSVFPRSSVIRPSANKTHDAGNSDPLSRGLLTWHSLIAA